MTTAGERFGPGGRFARLLERRPRLFSFVVAIVAARVVLSVVDLAESRVVAYSLVITAVLVLELAVIWRRVAPHRGRPSVERVGSEGSGQDRILRMAEHAGAPVVYLTTLAVLVGELVLALLGTSRAILLDITTAMRWIELVVLVAVILVARSWDRRFPEEA